MEVEGLSTTRQEIDTYRTFACEIWWDSDTVFICDYSIYVEYYLAYKALLWLRSHLVKGSYLVFL